MVRWRSDHGSGQKYISQAEAELIQKPTGLSVCLALLVPSLTAPVTPVRRRLSDVAPAVTRCTLCSVPADVPDMEALEPFSAENVTGNPPANAVQASNHKQSLPKLHLIAQATSTQLYTTPLPNG